MKKTINKAFASMLALTVCGVSLCSCSKDDGVRLSEADMEIWGVHASEKVLQDKSMDDYADIREGADVSLVMAKGEYESDQIIITPKVDIPYYNVSVSDLSQVGGDAKISKNSISVYHERYIPVSINPEKTGAPLGMYPDALVPFSAIVKYEENKIKANENQGVYITVETALDQAPGTYTGKVTLDFDSYVKTVDITVDVLDVTVSEETHAKSQFLTRWRFEHGELDSSQEKVDAYNDALIKYRLAPETVMLERGNSDADIQLYVEKSAEYLVDPRVSCLTIPTGSSTKESYDGKAYAAIDRETFEKYLRAYVKKSYELNFNLLEKLILYNGTLDEATFRSLPNEQVWLNAQIFNQTVAKIADEVEADETVTSPLKAEIAESIRTMPHVNTYAYVERYAQWDTDQYINTFCPLYNGMDTESQRAQYRESEKQPELWWYGCNNPTYPYTSYHVDMTNTLTARLLSWMQAEYDITGNLYWSVNDYGLLEDYFATDSYRGVGVTMEGILFYPGGQYGLTEPIASLRLESIRDGMEEYELLRSLKEKYKELGLDAEGFIASLTESLYTGARNTATTETFKQARTALLDACVVAQSSANLCVAKSIDNGGIIQTEVYINDGYTLKNFGTEITDKEAFGNGYLYTITTDLSKENYLDLSYEIAGKTYTYKQYLGGAVSSMSASELVDYFQEETAGMTAELVDGSTIGQTGQFVRLEIEETVDAYQTISLVCKKLNESLSKKTQKIVLNVYNGGDEAIELVLAVKYKKNDVYSATPTYLIEPGTVTPLEISFGSTNWSRDGEVQKIRFRFGNTEEEAAKVLYIKDVLIYEK